MGKGISSAPYKLIHKVGMFTRDMTLASGTQTITGIGFTPSVIIFFSIAQNTEGASWGIDDLTEHECVYQKWNGSCDTYHGHCIELRHSSGNIQHAIISSMDSDGFTLTWTKTASPTGNGFIKFLALKE